MKTVLRRIGILTVWLAACLSPVAGTAAEKPVFTDEQVATLNSLERVYREGMGAPLFLMRYVGDYGFDDYLKSGSSNRVDLMRFLEERFPLAAPSVARAGGGEGCSCFMARNAGGQVVYGRNLDLPGYHPAILLSTSPTKGYASVSMVELSVLGYPLTPENHDLPADLPGRAKLLAAPYVPRDGMNEHGLAVSTLNVPATEPVMDPAKVTLGRWQVNRLLLDHAKTVEEAVQLLGRFNVSVGDTGVHFFIADALGHSAVVEYPTGAAMTVTRNAQPWQVVTNFFVAGSGRVGFGQDRFDHVDQVLKAGQGVLPGDRAMKLLSEVSQSNTVWSVVYNLSNQKVHVAMARGYDAVCSPAASPCCLDRQPPGDSPSVFARGTVSTDHLEHSTRAVADTTVRPAGMTLEWTHFIGGSDFETVKTRTPVLDRDGMLWFLGETGSKDFATTPDALYRTYLGGSDFGKEDVYLMKFNTREPVIAYSTILGGEKGADVPSDLIVNANGTITIVGNTSSPDFPTTGDALTKQFQGPGNGRHDDGFLTILGDGGRKLQYSTFIGGTGGDRVTKVFIDPSGEMTLFGTTESPGFPTADAIRPVGVRDGSLFVIRLDAKGQRILSSRLLANCAPWEPDVQRLASGDFLITASTNNPAFQTTPGAFSSTYHGSSMQKMPDGNTWPGPGDIFIMRLSADLKTISFATLFGGAGDDYYPKIAIVPGGDFFVTGSTTSKDLPVTDDAVERTMESKRAVFLVRFSGDGGHLKYCTYLGGKGAEATSYAGGLVYDGRSRVYLGIGQVTSSDCPVTPDALQAKHQGGQDAVLLAFNVADSSLAYGSYLGGSKNEDMPILAFDTNGTLYVTGTTNSDDFPTLERTPAARKGWDIYISKFTVRNEPAGKQP